MLVGPHDGKPIPAVGLYIAAPAWCYIEIHQLVQRYLVVRQCLDRLYIGGVCRMTHFVRPGAVTPAVAVIRPRASTSAGSVSRDFELFYKDMFPKVYGYVRCQVRDVETARDIVSRAFLKAYQHREKAPPDEAMAHWLFRIVRNTLLDHWRVEGRRERASVSLDELAELPDSMASPEAKFASRERQVALLQAMKGLHERDRNLLLLRFMAELSNQEIAAILDLSEAAVSMRLVRALRRVRKRLRDL